MTWLKEWDACVFKTAAAQTAKKKAMQEKRKKAQSQANAGYGQQQQQLLEVREHVPGLAMASD